MFFKSFDLKKENEDKIGIIHTGSNAGIFKFAFSCKSFIIVPVPADEKDEFIKKYNSHINPVSEKIDSSIFELENDSSDLEDYYLIHKSDYKKFLAFQRSKKIDIEKINLIKKRYSEIKSQRSVAEEFNISLTTVNKILKDKY